MAIARQVFAAILLGLLVRAWRGFSMLDPFFFIPFACLSAVLAGPAIAELRRKQPGQAILHHICSAVLRSCGSVALMLAVPLIALNYPWYETWLLPQWSTALDAILLGLTSATAAAALTGLLITRVTAAVVKWLFRVLVFAGLVLYRFSPEDWGNATIRTVMDWGISTTALTVAAALLAADAVLIYLLARSRATTESV